MFSSARWTKLISDPADRGGLGRTNGRQGSENDASFGSLVKPAAGVPICERGFVCDSILPRSLFSLITADSRLLVLLC